MKNSFTFKNPNRVQCYHGDKYGNDISFIVEYKHWTWVYEPLTYQLDIFVPLGATKWLGALPEKNFTLEIQTPMYWYDHRKSFKRKPVYEKSNISWDSLTIDLIDVKFSKTEFNAYLNFKQPVKDFYGDQIMSIYQSMKGFWQEFRDLLKQAKNCDISELTNMLDSMNCRLISYNKDGLKAIPVNDAKISVRYPKLQHENEKTDINIIDLPF